MVPPYDGVGLAHFAADGVQVSAGCVAVVDLLLEHAVASTASDATRARRRRTRYSLPHNRGMVAQQEPASPAPSWTAPLFLVLAVLLIPWIVYLGLALPERATSAHWDVAWVGFDAMEFVALALTGWLAYRRSTWVEMAATAAAVMLIVDAWFDVTTANGGWNLMQAVMLGVGIELPLAGLSLGIARHAELVRRRP
jgi:hypothetical protein